MKTFFGGCGTLVDNWVPWRVSKVFLVFENTWFLTGRLLSGPPVPRPDNELAKNYFYEGY